ncbi:response regulator transcription factor (plasmid) [Ureibacillus chungkukjangi]|uniref:response regulator transcription factor n=1 Tax=Ureibacillus chungkukjangi TaxID=1202712 RepID=UPI000D3CC71B|nr:response regulator transcription factor [Ureibacillus chungkukjangi]MCM3390565.1 response regulator transcription factor [Ureibacillus chungkukjangi]MDI7743526.1 response regulator transcription factor [Lysinibacillus fusiformis]
MQTVLLVDDEQRMLDLIELFLIPQGIKCIKETSGNRAIEILKKEKVNLVLLDVMMPELDGWEVCKRIREFSNIPIIMLTARADKLDLVKGLNIGADDYISKPFDERELIARVSALLRRFSEVEKDTDANIRYNEFILDTEMYSLNYQNLTVNLTLKEFYILKALISRPSKTYTREELLDAAWEYETETDIRTVDSHIRNLRDKLKKAGFPTNEFLKTAWGIGYKWN